MGLARSTFYYQRKAPDPDDAAVTQSIESICLEFTGYGYRRVTKQLHHDGKVINHKRVLRLMRENDLLCRARRKRVTTTDSKHGFPRYPNLIKTLAVGAVNQVWLADITYIRIRSGFVYLRRSLMPIPEGSSAMPLPPRLKPLSLSRRFAWPSLPGTRRQASSTTQTRGCSTLQKNM